MRSADYLSFYADHFHTVEVDSTFYVCPSPRSVANWAARTPDGFIFSVKVPQVITHEKILVSCDAEFAGFVKTMDLLGQKLGPMVFQFPVFERWKIAKQEEFFAVLIPFLKKLPGDHRFAIEIRNKSWLDAAFADILRAYEVALVLQDRTRMPSPSELNFDPITADWTYIRWLGDRKGIEKLTTTWDRTVIDRTSELTSWVDFCYQIKKRGIVIYGYANNHYAGHGPATIAQFTKLWNAKGFPQIAPPQTSRQERTLFPM
jgi:uncharacterized protein YecE (DUF72 family)